MFLLSTICGSYRCLPLRLLRLQLPAENENRILLLTSMRLVGNAANTQKPRRDVLEGFTTIASKHFFVLHRKFFIDVVQYQSGVFIQIAGSPSAAAEDYNKKTRFRLSIPIAAQVRKLLMEFDEYSLQLGAAEYVVGHSTNPVSLKTAAVPDKDHQYMIFELEQSAAGRYLLIKGVQNTPECSVVVRNRYSLTVISLPCDGIRLMVIALSELLLNYGSVRPNAAK